jgi:hypothetical protein
MSASLDIFFLDSHTLGDPITLEGVVQVFSDAGFSIEEFEVNNQAIAWEREPKSMRRLLTLAHQARDCYLLVWNAEWRLEIRQYLAWGSLKMGRENRAWICTTTDNTPYFWRAEYNPARYSRFFLDIGKRLYEILRPTFGWIDFDYGLRTTHEDIEALELPTLYWANFFGPAYVDKIGRDKILSAPAWAIEELPDGGLLYVLASCPGLADDHVSVESVKAHFGIESVR